MLIWETLFYYKKIKHFQISYGVDSFTHHHHPSAHLLNHLSIPSSSIWAHIHPAIALVNTHHLKQRRLTQLNLNNQWDENTTDPLLRGDQRRRPLKKYLIWHMTTPKYRGRVESSTDMPAGSHLFSTSLTTLLPAHVNPSTVHDHTAFLRQHDRNSYLLNMLKGTMQSGHIESLTTCPPSLPISFRFSFMSKLKYKTVQLNRC